MNRREFVVAASLTTISIVLANCGGNPTGPSPTPTSIDLLTRLKQLNYSAVRKPYGTSGAAQIEISGSTIKNFKLGDTVLGVGSVIEHTLDVAAIQIPSDAQIIVS